MTQPTLIDVGHPLKEPVSAQALADCIGVDIRSIQDWDKAGHITRTEKGFYIVGEFLKGLYWWQRETINKKKPENGELTWEDLQEIFNALLEAREPRFSHNWNWDEIKDIMKFVYQRMNDGETLLRKTIVEKNTFELARRTRDAIENIPARLDAILAAETDQHKVRETLTKELKQALEGLSEK